MRLPATIGSVIVIAVVAALIGARFGRRGLALGIAAVVVTIAAWFAILFTGRYPRSMFDFVEGVLRWGQRVFGYAFLLVTDEYPPFSLSG